MTNTNIVSIDGDAFAAIDAGRDEAHPGILKRYMAGFHSLLDRSDLQFRIQRAWRVSAESGYSDYDLMVQVVIGEDTPAPLWEYPERGTGEDGAPYRSRGRRSARADLVIGFHLTGGGRVNLGPMWGEQRGLLTVWSTVSDEVSQFAIPYLHFARLVERVRDELAFALLDALIADRLPAVGNTGAPNLDELPLPTGPFNQWELPALIAALPPAPPVADGKSGW